MKTQRTARKATWISLAAAFIFAGILLMHASAATVAGDGHLGQALALRALSTSKSFFQGVADAGNIDPRHDANGRFIYSMQEMAASAARAQAVGPRATGYSSVNFPEPVQTQDVFAPSPNFDPIDANGPETVNANGQKVPLSSSATGQTLPPYYLKPTNLTPIFTRDQNYMVFASNRSATDPLQVATDGHYHIWAVPVSASGQGGGAPFQITTSSGDEAFPTLNANNTELAFTSTARTVVFEAANGITDASPKHDLYTIPFSETPGTVVNVNTLTNPVDTPAQNGNPAIGSSKTFVTPVLNGGTVVPQNSGGVGDVQRPTWDPSGLRLVFSALTQQATDTRLPAEQYAGHYHLYYLYVTTNGYLPQTGQTSGTPNPPGKLTDGPADDTDPTWEQTSGGEYIAFASTASSLSNTGAVAPAAATLTSAPLNSSGNRSIYVVIGNGSLALGATPNGGGHITNGSSAPSVGGLAVASTDDYAPAWSPNQSSQGINQYLNPNGTFEYLAFARSTSTVGSAALPATNHGIFYFRAVNPATTATLTPESGGNAVVQLNTSDPTNGFDDNYPTWSLSQTIATIAYASNRSVTYNNPTTGVPSETAINVPQGSGNLGTGNVFQATGNGFPTGQSGADPAYAIVPGNYGGAATSYTGILQSEVFNLNPPILRPYSTSELIHVNAASGASTTPNLNSIGTRIISPGGYVTFTVRLSNRESGISNAGANGLPDVYIQIKNPNSLYQGADHLEHKVFATNNEYYNVSSSSTPADLYNLNLEDFNFSGTPLHKRPDSGSSTILTLQGYNNFYAFAQGFNVVPYNATSPSPKIPQVGAVGGPDGDGEQGTISVGHDGGGTNGFPFTTAAGASSRAVLLPLGVDGAAQAGGDWKNFKPWGPEYECQFVNPNVTLSGGEPGSGDYGTPFYLAGYDDQSAFSGYDPQSGDITAPDNTNPVSQNAVHPPRPAAQGGTGSSSEWLQLQMVPATQQDNLGGVLYYATWKTPQTPSDWYLDVISYDNARYPALPRDTAPTYSNRSFSNSGVSTDPSGQAYRQDNWRVYDNIWGFTSQSSPPGRGDILVVSDYALGQKFAFSAFGNSGGTSNLPPKQYGTESYVTDVDPNILPNAALFNYDETGATDASGNAAVFPTTGYTSTIYPIVQRLDIYPQDQPGAGFGGAGYTAILNGLGVASYYDSIVGAQDDKDPVQNLYPYVRSQQYVIWRTLARGPVDQALLTGYAPQPVTQPAVNDPGNGTFTAAGGTAYDARRCVVWLSPYTHDLLTSNSGSGSLDDPNTQSLLENFVNNQSGRLFITGQDVASGTVGSGQTTGTFINSVLNANLANGANGTQQLAGAGLRITGSGQNGGGGLVFPTFSDTIGSYAITQFVTPSSNPLLLNNTTSATNNYVGFATNFPVPTTRLDAADSQVGPLLLNLGASDFVGQIDTVTPLTTATRPTSVDVTNGGDGLLYFQDTGSGARVVYAAFGIEALSTDYYHWISHTTATSTKNYNYYESGPTVHFSPHNQRQDVLHNIVDYLRTGTITGQIVQNSNSAAGGTQPVVGATVYLRPTGGTALPAGSPPLSAVTNSSGAYTIVGVEPGTYAVYAYAGGYTSGAGKTVVEVEGDTVAQEQAIDIEPVGGGTISGTVKDTTGAAVGGATVTFTNTVNPSISATTTTNGNGAYSVSLPIGTYTGVASKLPSLGQSGPQAPNNGPLTISTGTQLTNVNFQLSITPGAISGLVTDTSGNPLAGVTVTATAVGSTFTKNSDSVTSSSGAYTISNLPQGNYTLTATLANYTQVGTPPQVPVTAGVTTASPTTPTIQMQQAQSVTLQGTVYANGTPQPGATVTIRNQDGSAATFTVTTGTAGANGTVITNGSGQYAVTILQGTYTLTATYTGFNVATPTGGNPVSVQTTTTVNFSLTVTPAAHVFTGGHYNLFSLPFDDPSATAFNTLFGPVRTASNPTGNRSQAAIYQSSIGNYVYDPTAPADGIHIGRGYFVYLVNSVSLPQSAVSASPSGTVSVPLQGGPGLDGWNMIGVPSTSAIPVSSLSVRFSSGLTATFAQAVNNLHALSATLYSYDPTSNAYVPVTSTGSLQPYQGYWIQAKVAGLTLQIPGGGSATSSARSK